MDTQSLALTESPDLRGLTREDRSRIADYARAVLSPKTQRDYEGAWRDFRAYCDRRGFEPLPASPDVLAAYFTALADAGASVAQIDLKRAAIRHAHHVQGHTCATENPQIIALMKGIRHKRKVTRTPKHELMLDDVRRMVDALPTAEGLRVKRDRAMLLLGFWGGFRRSELVAVDVAHVRFGSDGVMRVAIPTSKTDQAGQGKTKTLQTLPDGLADVCPVRALRAWLDAAGIRSGAAFRAIDRWGHVRDGAMSGKEVARLVKRAAAAAGLEPRQFAGHSLRRGLVTEATDAGATSADIREQTGHESDQTLRLYQAQRGRGSLRAIEAIVRRHSTSAGRVSATMSGD